MDYLSKMEFNVDYRIAENDNDTFLLYAVSIPSFMYLDYFLEKNPDLNAVNDFGENILHCAIFSGSLETRIQLTNATLADDGMFRTLMCIY